MGVRKPAMAFPTFPIGHINPRDGFGMAALTIGFGNPGPTVRQPDFVRNPAGVKNKGIPHALNTLLGQVVDYLIIRQMAIDAFDSAVGPLMPPGFIFSLHDMAGGTEFRGFGLGIKFWRAEGGQ